MGRHLFSFVCDFCKHKIYYDNNFDDKTYSSKFDIRAIHPFTSIFGKLEDEKVVKDSVLNGNSNIEICEECIEKIICYINSDVIIKESKT